VDLTQTDPAKGLTSTAIQPGPRSRRDSIAIQGAESHLTAIQFDPATIHRVPGVGWP
jgi:hypothetical protein